MQFFDLVKEEKKINEKCKEYLPGLILMVRFRKITVSGRDG